MHDQMFASVSSSPKHLTYLCNLALALSADNDSNRKVYLQRLCKQNLYVLVIYFLNYTNISQFLKCINQQLSGYHQA